MSLCESKCNYESAVYFMFVFQIPFWVWRLFFSIKYLCFFLNFKTGSEIFIEFFFFVLKPTYLFSLFFYFVFVINFIFKCCFMLFFVCFPEFSRIFMQFLKLYLPLQYNRHFFLFFVNLFADGLNWEHFLSYSSYIFFWSYTQ